MQTQRRIVLMGGCVLVVALGIRPALSQEPPPGQDEKAQAAEEIRLTREVISQERQALVSRAMDLTPGEMQRFWPLYREYRVAAAKVGDRLVHLLTTYADHQQHLTDPVADQLLTEFVRIEEARARLKAQYLPKFKKVLPVKKVARFYQIENKLDTALLAELTEGIPLAR